jgi:outer membrane protein assembly factor BamB
MSTSRTRPRRYWTGALIAVLGIAVIIGTIVAKWRHLPYGLGVAALVIGGVIVITAIAQRPVVKAVAGVATAAVLVAGGVLAVTGIPNSLPRWDTRHFEGLDSWSARTGEILVSGRTAYDATTGDIEWEFDGTSANPLLVRSDVVVLGTPDETIGLETSTGREMWRSPVAGRGIATNGSILVVSHVISDTEATAAQDPETEAVALDLTTGKTLWQRPGRPVMECNLGAVDRFSVAPERSYVLIAGQSGVSSAELVSVADGSTTVSEVDCSISARITGDVLLEVNGETLVGLSPADGTELWSTSVQNPWSIAGSGPTLIAASRAGIGSATFTAIEIASGQARTVESPEGRALPLSSIEFYRSAEVWVLVDLEPGAAVWNAGTGELVRIPGATSVDDYSVDVYSGWMALSGTTEDITGTPTPQCWALSQSGELYGPAPGPGCYVDEGILQTDAGIYPLQ